LGDGLLISSGRKWLTRRKMITPSFHFNILKQFVQTFDDHGCILVDKLSGPSSAKEPQEVDVMQYIGAYTLDVICETAMGVNMGSQTKTNIPYVNALKK
jgi:cytochrome P450 family 4